MDTTSPPTTPDVPRVRRPDRSGSEFEYTRTVNGKPYTRWRAMDWLVVGNDRIKVVGEGKTLPDARAALQRNITRRQVALGVTGPEVLSLTKGERSYTVAALMADYMAYKKPKMRTNAYKMYDAKVRNYIVPYLGSTPIRLLDHDQLQKFIHTTLPALTKPDKTPMLANTARRQVYSVLSGALRYAVKHRKLDLNPLSTVDSPDKNVRTKAHVSALSAAAQWVPQQITKTVYGQPNELRWLLALHGLRQSEALGLTDDCFLPNLRKPNRIAIKQQLDRITNDHGCGPYDAATRSWPCGKQSDQCPNPSGESRLYIREETKSRSGDRALPLTPLLREALTRQLRYRDELRQNPAFQPLDGPKMDSLIFVKANGRPIRPQDDRRAWSRLLDTAHVTNRVPVTLRVHDARHMAATLAFQSGFSPEKIALMFGWSPRHLHEMLQTYAHPSAKALQQEMDAIGSILSQRLDGNP